MKDEVEKMVFTVYEDKDFLLLCFKGLDGDDDGYLTEEEMRHWVYMLSTCQPGVQISTLPVDKDKHDEERFPSWHRPFEWVPVALGHVPEPEFGKELQHVKKEERPSWISDNLAATTLEDDMENIIVECLKKRGESGASAAVRFDWHDFLVICMDFYLALGRRALHAIFSALLGKEAAEDAEAAAAEATSAMNGAGSPVADDGTEVTNVHSDEALEESEVTQAEVRPAQVHRSPPPAHEHATRPPPRQDVALAGGRVHTNHVMRVT